jgi:hypothetical protein
LDELARLMTLLSQRRPLYHSEADFQHELAWEARVAGLAEGARLELPCDTPEGRIAVDIVLRTGTQLIGLELKYWKRRLLVDVGGERFALKDQGARDLARYDFWSDVARLERLVDGGVLTSAFAMALTNDPGFWKPGRDGTTDEAFQLHEGRRVSGRLSWAAHAGVGTMRGRERVIALVREHSLTWRDYSNVGGQAFRWCALRIEARGSAPSGVSG